MADWIIYFGLFVLVNCLALAGMMLVRRNVKLSTLESHHEVAGFIYAVVGLIYGVLIAFVVLVVWEQYNTANERVGSEAAVLISIYRDSQVLPDSVKNHIDPVIKDYCNSVINDEFPAMADGRLSSRTDRIYSRLWQNVYRYMPASQQESLWNSEILSQMNKFSECRRLRILSLYYNVPGFMWFVLIMGAILTVGYCYFFATKGILSQALMVICLTSVVCLVLILIEALDHPFEGMIKVSSQPFIEVIQLIKIR